jgi:hypothetical protein
VLPASADQGARPLAAMQLCADSPRRLPLAWDEVLRAAAAGLERQRVPAAEVADACLLAGQQLLLARPAAAGQAALRHAAAALLSGGQLRAGCKLLHGWHGAAGQEAASSGAVPPLASDDLQQLVQEVLPQLAASSAAQALTLDELAAAHEAWRAAIQQGGSKGRARHAKQPAERAAQLGAGLLAEGLAGCCRAWQATQQGGWASQLPAHQQVGRRAVFAAARCSGPAAELWMSKLSKRRPLLLAAGAGSRGLHGRRRARPGAGAVHGAEWRGQQEGSAAGGLPGGGGAAQALGAG